jgi:hypothetical protein
MRITRAKRYLLRRLGPPSPAMVVALIALFIALASGAYAAVTIPSNSVGTAQLKDGSVTARKLHNGAFTAAKIAFGTLLAKDFKPGQLPAGGRGDTGPSGVEGSAGPAGNAGATGATGSGAGPAGATGATGAKGSAGVVGIHVFHETFAIAAGPGKEVNKTMSCEGEELATGGGYTIPSGDELEVFANEPGAEDKGWHIGILNKSVTERTGSVYVVCAQHGS